MTGAQFLQYVTRWQMGNTIYYAMMETTPVLAAAGKYQFYAGRAQSIDLALDGLRSMHPNCLKARSM